MTFFTNSSFQKAVTIIGFLVSSANAVDPVLLGTAGYFAILTKSGVTTTGVTSVKGDIGTSPIASTAITGFGLILDSTTTFATSSFVTGEVYAASYTSPTPSKMTTAVSDMETAFTDAAGRPTPDVLNLGAGNIEGETLLPGLYKWSTGVEFTDSITFDGNGNEDAVWILQIAKNLDVDSGANVILSGGAKAENIFWQISGSTILQPYAHVEGVFLCATQIIFMTGSSMTGAALSQTAVTLDTATIVKNSAEPL